MESLCDTGFVQQIASDCSHVKSASAALMGCLEDMTMHISQWEKQQRVVRNLSSIMSANSSSRKTAEPWSKHTSGPGQSQKGESKQLSSKPNIPSIDLMGFPNSLAEGTVITSEKSNPDSSPRSNDSSIYAPVLQGCVMKAVNQFVDEEGDATIGDIITSDQIDQAVRISVEQLTKSDQLDETVRQSVDQLTKYVSFGSPGLYDSLRDSVASNCVGEAPDIALDESEVQLMQHMGTLTETQMPTEYRMWLAIVDKLLETAKKKKYYELRDSWIQPDTFLQKIMRNHDGLDLRVLLKSASEAKADANSRRSSHAATLHGFESYIQQTFVHGGASDTNKKLRKTMNRHESNAAGEKAGGKKIRKPRWFVWDPHSPKKLIWTGLGMLLMLYDLCILPMQAFSLDEDTFLVTMQWFGQIFWTLDMGVTFITGVYRNGRLSTSLRIIAKTYVTTWFAFDLALVAPLWIAQIAGGGQSGSAKGASVFRAIRMLRFLRLVRMAKFQHYLHEALAAINSSYLILCLQIIKLMLGMMLISHLNACCWYAVGKACERGWVDQYEDTNKFYRYLTAMHWAFTQFQGTSEILPGMGGGRDMGERLYAVLCVMLALIILASFVSSLTNMMMQLQSLREERMGVARAVQKYLGDNAISTALSIRVKKYLDWKQNMQRRLVDSAVVLKMLPAALQIDLQEEVMGPLISQHAFWGAIWVVHSKTFRMLCHEVLTSITPAPGEIVFSVQTECTRMFVVVSGQCIYVPKKANRAVSPFADQMSVMNPQASITPRDHDIMQDTVSMDDRVQGASSISKQRSLKRQDAGVDDRMSRWDAEEDTGHGHLPMMTCLSEAILWTTWEHMGALLSVSDATFITVGAKEFGAKICQNPPARVSSIIYARRFVAGLNKFGKTYNDVVDLDSMVEVQEDDNSP